MFSAPSDEALIQRALAGSQRAWVKLVERHERQVYNYWLGNNINQLQKEYQNERNAAAEARHTQQTAVIFETLCKYGNTLQVG